MPKRIGNAILSYVDRLIEILCRKNHIVTFRDHHFLESLDAQSLIIDLGAHKGEFSGRLGQCFGCRCIAVEPNPVLFDGIAETALVKKYNYAVSGQNGPVHFHLSDNPEASSLMKEMADFWGMQKSIEVAGIRLEDFFDNLQIKAVDLLKVDIEGGEIEMFRSVSDKTLRSIRQITIEFHTFCNPAIEEDVSRIKERLKRIGFVCLPFPIKTSLSLDCDTLFINEKELGSGRIQRFRNTIPLLALKAVLFLPVLRLKAGSWKTRLVPRPGQ